MFALIAGSDKSLRSFKKHLKTENAKRFFPTEPAPLVRPFGGDKAKNAGSNYFALETNPWNISREISEISGTF